MEGGPPRCDVLLFSLASYYVNEMGFYDIIFPVTVRCVQLHDPIAEFAIEHSFSYYASHHIYVAHVIFIVIRANNRSLKYYRF